MMQEVPHHQKRLSCSLKARKPIKAWKLERERFRRNLVMLHTVRNLHFLSKNSTLISRENCRILGVKNSWICCGFWLLSFDFTRKAVKKFGVKNSWKCWGFVEIEFLDKKLTFRIVWRNLVMLITFFPYVMPQTRLPF